MEAIVHGKRYCIVYYHKLCPVRLGRRMKVLHVDKEARVVHADARGFQRALDSVFSTQVVHVNACE